MGRRMPYRLQVRKIREYLRRQGIDPATVDVEALVDPELSYRENLKAIKKYVSKRYGEDLEEALSHLLYTASLLHESRSERSQALDNRLKASVVIKPKPTPKVIAQIQRWMEHPERYDIEGIDVFPGSLSRRRRRHRRSRGRRRR